MTWNFSDWPGTNDAKWFALRGSGFDLPEAHWSAFLAEYKPMWDYWQRAYRAFDPNPRPIWGEGGAPGYREDFGQPQPSVGVRIHSGAARGMVLVCAGGGWFWKACYEGPIVAERFYDEGFNVAVLDYRVNPYPGAAACDDAMRAMRYLRYHAPELNTRPDKIGMMGFSAGAFLSAHCAALFDRGDSSAEDPVARSTSRPDAAVLSYGAGATVTASQGLLNYSRERQSRLFETAVDRHIGPDCPPVFLWQCAGMDDPREATRLADALAAAGVPFELHLFPFGAHGTALSNDQHPDKAANDPHVAHWVELCCEWLRLFGF